jgi:glycosyltransferase involved in cell wall biosynthesis
VIEDNVKPVLRRYADLPIEWAPGLPHPQLAERLRSADIFVLPSLEDGFARTVTEALSCGLPAIVTPNTGASDLVTQGVSGSIVAIRDPAQIAAAVLEWWERLRNRAEPPSRLLDPERVSFESFARDFIGQLRDRHLISAPPASAVESRPKQCD